MLSPRLQRLPRRQVFGFPIPVAQGFRARLLGLGGLERDEAEPGLLIPHCGSVHTFGMRFPLDLVFLDREERPVSVRIAVPPRRFAWQRGAATVLEIPSGKGERFAPPRLDDPCRYFPNAKRSPVSSSARTTR